LNEHLNEKKSYAINKKFKYVPIVSCSWVAHENHRISNLLDSTKEKDEPQLEKKKSGIVI
jgi:hypothetical protein